MKRWKLSSWLSKLLWNLNIFFKASSECSSHMITRHQRWMSSYDRSEHFKFSVKVVMKPVRRNILKHLNPKQYRRISSVCLSVTENTFLWFTGWVRRNLLLLQWSLGFVMRHLLLVWVSTHFSMVLNEWCYFRKSP